MGRGSAGPGTREDASEDVKREMRGRVALNCKVSLSLSLDHKYPTYSLKRGIEETCILLIDNPNRLQTRR